VDAGVMKITRILGMIPLRENLHRYYHI